MAEARLDRLGKSCRLFRDGIFSGRHHYCISDRHVPNCGKMRRINVESQGEQRHSGNRSKHKYKLD